jgi:hypothetical protein
MRYPNNDMCGGQDFLVNRESGCILMDAELEYEAACRIWNATNPLQAVLAGWPTGVSYLTHAARCAGLNQNRSARINVLGYTLAPVDDLYILIQLWNRPSTRLG